MQIEIWKKVNINPIYSVSNFGRVRNRKTGRVLKPWRHRTGHCYVTLGGGRRKPVHHLVLEAFVGKRPPSFEALHKNGIPADNKPRNLRWGTRKDNLDDYARLNRRHIKGSITFEIANQIRSQFTGKHGNRRFLAKQFGVSEHVIGKVINRRTYTYAG